MPKKSNFKCKSCGKKLTQLGKDYGSNFRFFACLNCNKDGGFWIDIIKRIDQYKNKY